MHSETLQQRFPEIYQDFFAKCSTVVSAPGSFFWSAGLAVMYGGAGIMQKIPLRAYIGIERDNGKTLRYGEYICYAPHQQQFEFTHHTKIFEMKYLKLLNELRKSLPAQISGKIHILSEIPFGAGLNLSAAINISLSVLLGLESGFLDPQKLESLISSKTPDIIRDQVFDKLFRMSWKLEANTDEGASSGAAVFTSFIESTTPVIYFTERRDGTYTNHPNTRLPSIIDGHYEIFDQAEYAGYRLKDLFSWLGDPNWPVDYGLIYLGQQKSTTAFLKPMRVAQAGLNVLEDFVAKYAGQFPKDAPANLIPPFAAMTRSYDQQGFWKNSLDFLIILSIKALYDMKTLIENGTGEALNELYHSVSLQDKIYEFFTPGLPLPTDRDIFDKLKHVTQDKNSNGFRSIRFLPDRGDGGGDMLFIAPQGYLQENLESFTMLLRTHISPLVRIDYSSWLDGEETGGVRMEQNFGSGCYSQFVTEGAVSMLEWRSNETTPTRRVYSIEAYDKVRGQIDLLLDDVNQKVCIRGSCLNSKQIKSGRATIEILKILLNKYGQEVPATSLPDSTYVERNEMQSKIITPLVTTFKQCAGKKLPLSLHGGLRKNFTIKLQPSNIVIGILERQV